MNVKTCQTSTSTNKVSRHFRQFNQSIREWRTEPEDWRAKGLSVICQFVKSNNHPICRFGAADWQPLGLARFWHTHTHPYARENTSSIDKFSNWNVLQVHTTNSIVVMELESFDWLTGIVLLWWLVGYVFWSAVCSRIKGEFMVFIFTSV